MMSTRAPALRQAFTGLAVIALLAACSEQGPAEPRATSPARLTAAETNAVADARFPELGSCGKLQAPEGSKVTFRTYASGVQIYRWNGASWSFVAPSADLFADAGMNGLVGTHFGGPTWLTVSGSRVVGSVRDRCIADPASIPWLLLDAVASGSGVFEQTTLIQRLNTVGGNAPAAAGSVVGEEVRVPYLAEYVFYWTM